MSVPEPVEGRGRHVSRRLGPNAPPSQSGSGPSTTSVKEREEESRDKHHLVQGGVTWTSTPGQRQSAQRRSREAVVTNDRFPPDTSVTRSQLNVSDLVRGFGVVVPPLTLLTALTFYFGLEFVNARSLYFGIDYSTLGYSPQDYILRSSDALFVPMAILIAVGLVCLRVHGLIMATIETSRYRSGLRYASRGVEGLGLVLFAVGGEAFLPLPSVPTLSIPTIRPLCLGLGVGLVSYASNLMRRLNDGRDSPGADQLARMIAGLVLLLLSLSLFWAVSEYAQALGRGRAKQLAADLTARPGVVVYSKQRLLIATDSPAVKEAHIDSADAAYHYRYSGLRLLVQSGGKFFLLPERWSPADGVAIVMPDNDAVRLAYTPGSP